MPWMSFSGRWRGICSREVGRRKRLPHFGLPASGALVINLNLLGNDTFPWNEGTQRTQTR
jgi:hypothetical protein